MVGYFIQIPYEVLYDVSKYLVRGKVVYHKISASPHVHVCAEQNMHMRRKSGKS